MPAYALNVYFRGDLVVSQANFTNLAGAPTDPTTITATIQFPSAPWITYVYPATIVRVSQGIYTLNVDTSPCEGEYVIHWTGSGAVQKIWDDVFMVYANK